MVPGLAEDSLTPKLSVTTAQPTTGSQFRAYIVTEIWEGAAARMLVGESGWLLATARRHRYHPAGYMKGRPGYIRDQ
jgi:hypothetical protein